MKLEVGKTYISKLGTKAKIVSCEGNTPFQFIGVINTGHEVTSFNEDGKSITYGFELVEEFKEKPVLNLKLNDLYKWAAMDKNGAWFLYKTQPKISLCAWVNTTPVVVAYSVARIPTEFAPTYSGDWVDSLIEL